MTELSIQGTGEPWRENGQPSLERFRKGSMEERSLVTSEEMRAVATWRVWTGQKKGGVRVGEGRKLSKGRKQEQRKRVNMKTKSFS